jgi:hypothetical protein
MNADAPDRDASAKHSSSRRGLHPFDRRLLGRMAVARWALAADVAARLTGTLLLLAQVTLLAAVIVARAGLARVAGGRRPG